MFLKRLRQFATTADWLWVVAAVLAMAAPWFDLRPFKSDDGWVHLFRSVEMDWLLRHGVLWPRYAPDLAYGYGYPLFNYYPPFVYYLMSVLHWLGLDFVPAMHVLSGLAPLVGAVGVFCLVRHWYGRLGAGMAAAAYAFSPFLVYSDIARGSLAEVVGWAVFPWALWSLREALTKPSLGSVSRWICLYALLFVHNITAMISTAILGIFGAAQLIWWWVGPVWSQSTLQADPLGRLGPVLKRAWPAAIGGIVSIAVTACFWLPALGETSYVRIQRAVQDILDFRGNFINAQDWLAWPYVLDPRSVAWELSPIPKTLGLPHFLLALIGVLALSRYPSRAARLGGWLSFGMLTGLLWLTTKGSLRIWEALPLLPLLQFPWRLLAPASLFAAILAGAAFGAIRLPGSRSWVRWLPLLGLLTFAFYSFTWTYRPRVPAIIQPGIEAISAYEKLFGLGTNTSGEYLPVGVKEMPPADGLRARYAAKPVIDRLDFAALPAGVQAQPEESQVLETQVAFEAAEPFEATFLWFYFPGWQAQVDGLAVPIRVTDPNGFIAVPVPAGRHTVRVYFGDTPLRQVAAGLSLAGLAAAGILLWSLRRRAKVPAVVGPSSWLPGERFVAWTLALGGLGLFGLRLVLSGDGHLFYRSPYDGQTVSGAQVMDIDYGHQLNLFAITPPPRQAAAGEALALTLYWRPYDHPVDGDYSIAVHLVDQAGRKYAVADSWRPQGEPTQFWNPGTYATDVHVLTPMAETPPGEYRVLVAAYGLGGGPRLPAYDPTGQPLGDMVEVARVELTEAGQAPSDAELGPSHRVNAKLGAVELVGFDLNTTEVKQGENLALTLFWRVGATAPLPDLTAQVAWRAPDGRRYSLGQFAPVRPDFPTSKWRAGSAYRGVSLDMVMVPSESEGMGALVLSLATSDGQPYAGPVDLTEMTVTAPARVEVMPAVDQAMQVRYGEALLLRGLDWQVAAGEAPTVTVQLVWAPLAIVSTRYEVRVRLVDGQGQAEGEQVSQPVNGERPTTSWLPGEYVVDPHAVVVSGGAVRQALGIEIGVYDKWTGTWLPAYDERDGALGETPVLASVEIK